MKKIVLICLFLSGLFIEVNMGSFSFSLKWNYRLTAADPTPTELYHCKDEFGEYISNLPCDFDGGTRACDSCYAQMEYDEYEDCFLCPNVSYCCGCENYVHMSSHDCPKSNLLDDSGKDNNGSPLTGGGNGKSGGTGVCGVCSKNPCQCKTDEDEKTKRHPITLSVDELRKAISDAFNTVNTANPTGAHCSEGVWEAFKNAFGYDMARMNANSMLTTMSSSSSSWAEVSLSDVNVYASLGCFIVGGLICPCPGYETATHGHVVTVLPGYNGTTLRDIHVMDTGVPSIRSDDKSINKSFKSDSHSNIHFYIYLGQ